MVLAQLRPPVIRPDRGQVEGPVVYGLSAALYGEWTVQRRMVGAELPHLPAPALIEMPKVETVIVPTYDSGGSASDICVVTPACSTRSRLRREAVPACR